MNTPNKTRQTDPLFVALTKRETWLGGLLPYKESIYVAMISGLLFLLTQLLSPGLMSLIVCIGFAAIALIALALMTMHDEDLITILKLRLRLWLKAPNWNASHWGARSYEP